MNLKFSCTVVIFLLATLSLIAQDCSSLPTFNFPIGNTNNYCAPTSIELTNLFPEDANLTSIYSIYIHDLASGEVNNLDTTIFITNNSPDFFFEFTSSTCSANGNEYVFEITYTDSLCGFDSVPIGSYENILVSSGASASLERVQVSCSTYNFQNTSEYGENADGCEDYPDNFYWKIIPNSFEINSGTTGNIIENGSDNISLNFNEPGIYEVEIIARSCNDSRDTSIICIEDLNTDFEYNIPDTVCIDEFLVLENNSEDIFFCSTNLNWEITQISNNSNCELVLENYQLQNSSNLSSYQPSLSFNNSGTYKITLNNLGCDDVELLNKTIFVQGKAKYQNSSYIQECNVLEIDLNIDVNTCGSEQTEASWSLLNQTSTDSFSSSIIDVINLSFDNEGDYELLYILESLCGSDSSIIDITLSPLLEVSLGNDTIVCSGSDLTINTQVAHGKIPYNYDWDPSISTSSSISLISVENQEIIVTVTDSLGCTASDSVFINIQNSLNFTLQDTAVCAGTELELIATNLEGDGPFLFEWDNSVLDSNYFVTSEESSVHFLTITDSIGCFIRDSLSIEVPVIELDIIDIVQCLDDPASIILPTFYDNDSWYLAENTNNTLFDLDGDFLFVTNVNQANNTVYYYLDTLNCNYQDSLNIYLPSNPFLNLLSFPFPQICEGVEFSVTMPEIVFSNSLDTDYSLTIYQGGEDVFSQIEFNQLSIPDSIFFEDSLNSSCGLEYLSFGSIDNNYHVVLTAENQCGINVTKTNFAVSSNPTANFITENEECSNSYIFINSTEVSIVNVDNSCSFDANITWSIAQGEEGIDWVLTNSFLGDSIGGGSDSLKVEFLTPNTYDVQLVSSSMCGSDTVVYSYCIEDSINSVVSFSRSSCASEEVNLINQTDTSKNCNTEYLWSINQLELFCNQNSNQDFSILNSESSNSSITFNNAGDYLISCQTSNSCFSETLTDTITITGPPNILSLEFIPSICFNDQLNVQSEFDNCEANITDYSWSIDGANFLDTTASISNLFIDFSNVFGSADITLSLSNECGNTSIIEAYTFEEQEPVELNILEYCLSEIPQLLENNNNGIWSGTPISSEDQNYYFTPNIIGNFNLTYIYFDNFGCEVVNLQEINVLQVPTINIQDTIITSVGITEVITSSPLNGLWVNLYPGIVTVNQNNISSSEIGQYTLTYSEGENTCYVEESLVFIVNPLPEINLTDTIICFGDEISIIPEISSSQTPLTFLWSTEDESQEITVAPESSTNYLLTVTDVNGGQSFTDVNIEVSCPGINFDDFVPFSISNNMNTSFVGSPSNENFLFEGCSEATIIFNTLDCFDENIPINYSVFGTSSINLDYELSSDSLVLTSNNPASLVINALLDDIIEGTESLIIIIEPIVYSDCYSIPSETIEFTINDQPLLNLTLSNDTSIYCPETPITLNSNINGGVAEFSINTSNNYSYQWEDIQSDTLANADNFVATPTTTTTYLLTVTDNTCWQQTTDYVTVNVPEYSDIVIELQDIYLCYDSIVELCPLRVSGGEGNYSYQWDNGTTDSCNMVGLGDFTLTATDACNMEAMNTVSVAILESPTPFFESLEIIDTPFAIEFNNYTSNSMSYYNQWNFGDNTGIELNNETSVYHEYAAPGNYNVQLTSTSNISGCKNAYTETIQVEDFFKIFIPNTFSPNGDNKNDIFKIEIINEDFFEMKVYNRYGKLVFESNDSQIGWDGVDVNNNKNCVIGSFNYYIKYSKINSAYNEIKSGVVHLIK